MTGYGELSGSIVVGEYRVLCEPLAGGVYSYKRFRGEELVKSIIVSDPRRFELIPLYPVFTPYTITKHVITYLSEKLVVPGNGSLTIYFKIPVDIGVYVYDRSGGYELIDVFSTTLVKYAVYGDVENGLIARYYESPVYRELVKPSLGEALVKLNIVNKHGKWVRVGKVLLDSQLLRLHYVEGAWEAYTQEIYMEIESPTIAYLSYGSPFTRAEPIRDPEGFKPPRLRGRSEMLWGLS